MTFSLDQNYLYNSRRSVVMSSRAAVASSQPLATEAGLATLRSGGSAADAAVAVAAALQVTQPCSTGLGGDAFFLYYEAESKTIHAYNGSGRSPAALSLEEASAAAVDGSLPNYHPLTVTVPGAADTWLALHDRFGTLELSAVLEPAIRLAADGFPVAPMTSLWWKAGAERQLSLHRHGHELMINGRGPEPGELFRNPGLAWTLERMAAEGKKPFYTGEIAERIVEAVGEAGGVLAAGDLEGHSGEWVSPVSVSYNGYRVHECPPNGQGLAVLIALGIYRELTAGGAPASGDAADELHAKIECMRLAFADASHYIADPRHARIPVQELLAPDYLQKRAKLIKFSKATDAPLHGTPPSATVGDDTVYFSVVDSAGNGCSFINSNFMGFGTGIVPRGCGFSLQNRGRGFVLTDGHPNVLGPGKRPYHTIIPALITEETGGELAAVFGIMGGMMQPQAHFQVATAMIDGGLDPQSALDMARFQLQDGDPAGTVLVEASMNPQLVADLRSKGHSVVEVDGPRRSLFGLGQVIARTGGCWWSGSDPRGDGHAAGF